jgi:hypothetical protein
MNLEQTAAILAKVAALDGRNDTDSAILAWHEVIADLDYQDALRAVAMHRMESTEYLMPVHVRQLVARIRSERGDADRRGERQRELDAYAAQAGPLADRSEEIQEFVGDVRDVLPEGNVRALFPRREAWKREQQARTRPDAEPNPLWDPTIGPASTWQRSKGKPVGAWWENEAEREADSRKILHLAGRLKRRREQTEEAS